MKETVHIRVACSEDFSVIRSIVHTTITKIYPHYYPKGAVEFFLSLHNDGAIKEDIEKHKVYVVSAGQTDIATVTIDGNEISRLFVLPDYQGQGFGSYILDWAEETIFEAYDAVQLHASFPGKSIYIKRGYEFFEYRKREVDYQDWLCIDILEKKKNT